MARTVALTFGVIIPSTDWVRPADDGMGMADVISTGLTTAATFTFAAGTYTDNGNGTITIPDGTYTDNGDGTITL